MFVTLTTTPTIEGRRIVEYKGIVFGEVISGVDFVKDFAAGLTNFFGGRSNSYEGELQKARGTGSGRAPAAGLRHGRQRRCGCGPGL